ncbi:translation initiation factor IF-3 [Flavobacterium columnare NBRC 100251 = ATCC 23463]|uniref:Translation initiation factor IF-3 n=1 Tax=Flavobacterium columnare TaxID=996 RepID=A0AAI8GC74_9FLAO|nr:translation initiation factor IF-3 [Flavobacterium columnare]PDS22470.1 translation initiation factor IF-3 [Flavobacterium columnare NBRC 100251 = ATCC 23463]APT21184.1 translation initiation factor IF-3 [Flavobacterium columnare]MBF6653715.1 translation initiation factor IF-3 [Flavobacterium columnare]MBF6656574.1 translation initiation factor IF-3 [Flavobacterium columnare]
MRNNRGNQPRVEKKDEHRINQYIRVPEIRLVGDNVEPGVVKTSDALRMADELELDLVEISPNAEPPVCKIMDYKKFLYEQKRREKELKAKSTQIVIKEIRFGPQTDEHDYEFKKKNAEKFLKDGAKLKAFVFFKGRSIIYKEQGQILLLRLAQDLEEVGKVEAMPVLEGKRMIMFITPKKKGK